MINLKLTWDEKENSMNTTLPYGFRSLQIFASNPMEKFPTQLLHSMVQIHKTLLHSALQSALVMQYELLNSYLFKLTNQA